MKKNFLSSVATLGFVGRFYGSGTLATVVTLPIVYAMKQFSIATYAAFVLLMFFIAFKACAAALRYYEKPDPREIVIDEFLGCLITFCAIPITVYTLIVGFLLFRFFDITKFFGIKQLGKLRGPWGVLLDDVAAGMMSNVLLYIIFLA